MASADTWRITGVIRGKSIKTTPRGADPYLINIPWNADDLVVLKCDNIDDIKQLDEMSESEVKAALSDTWCRVKYRGEIGWVKGKYLSRANEGNSGSTANTDLWLAVFSSQSLDKAISKAVTLSKSFPSTMVFATASGFYSVVLGRGPEDEVEKYRTALINEGTIASDSYLTLGARFTDVMWPPDLATKTPSAPEVKAEPQPTTQEQISTGTGFQITPEGHVVTNFHVAGDCRKISLSKPSDLPVPASLLASDRDNDLVILKASGLPKDSVAPLRDGNSPKAGTEIVVFGFPLTGLLASNGNVVTGNITSLAGLGNKASQYQISAPVQPGNSGGPVLDREGRVVAVVVSKLDAMKAVETTGDIPQNINFAIKESVLRNFLESSSVKFQSQSSGTPMDTPTLAEKAQTFTYMVECRK
jgi:S1-C subfamily serine protease